MRKSEQTRLEYEIRLREAPSTKLWCQYAQWEASTGQIELACIVFERYLAATSNPTTEMWDLYAKTAPTYAMKRDILLRAVQQQPLSTELHKHLIGLILSAKDTPANVVPEIEQLFHDWMKAVLEHGSPSNLEALFGVLAHTVGELSKQTSNICYEEVIFILLRSYIAIPEIINSLSFVLITLRKLSLSPRIDYLKILYIAIQIFVLSFLTVSSSKQQYEALYNLYLVCQSVKQRVSMLAFAEALLSSTSPFNEAINECVCQSLYSFLSSVRSSTEVAIPSGTNNLCLLLAYDSILTLQVEDRVLPNTRSSIFNIIDASMLDNEDWWNQLDILQRLLTSDLILYRGRAVVATLHQHLTSENIASALSLDIPRERFVEIYTTVSCLLQQYSSTQAAIDSARLLLKLLLPAFTHNSLEFVGFGEGLLQVLLTSTQHAVFTNEICSILEMESSELLFEPKTVDLLLNYMRTKHAFKAPSTFLGILRMILISILENQADTAIKLIHMLRGSLSYFSIFRHVTQTIFSNTRVNGPFNLTLKCLLDVLSTIVGNDQFRSDLANFFMEILPQIEEEPIGTFLEDAALFLLIFLTDLIHGQALNLTLTQGMNSTEQTLDAIFNRLMEIYKNIQMGDHEFLDQYAKVSSLVNTVFEYFKAITGAERLVNRIVTECWIVGECGDKSKCFLMYEIIGMEFPAGHGLLALLKKQESATINRQ